MSLGHDHFPATFSRSLDCDHGSSTEKRSGVRTLVGCVPVAYPSGSSSWYPAGVGAMMVPVLGALEMALVPTLGPAKRLGEIGVVHDVVPSENRKA